MPYLRDFPATTRIYVFQAYNLHDSACNIILSLGTLVFGVLAPPRERGGPILSTGFLGSINRGTRRYHATSPVFSATTPILACKMTMLDFVSQAPVLACVGTVSRLQYISAHALGGLTWRPRRQRRGADHVWPRACFRVFDHHAGKLHENEVSIPRSTLSLFQK